MGGADVNQPRAADDFATIRALNGGAAPPTPRCRRFRNDPRPHGGTPALTRGNQARREGAARPTPAARWRHSLAAIGDRRGARASTPIWPHTQLGRERALSTSPTQRAFSGPTRLE